MTAALSAVAGRFYMPGECVCEVPSNSPDIIQIGRGLRHEHNKIFATTAGTLTFLARRQFAQLSSWRAKYEPKVDDIVIGSIVGRIGNDYVVDLGAGLEARQNSMEFQGAGPKTKNRLKRGDLILSRVTNSFPSHMPTLSSRSPTGSEGFGVLPGGRSRMFPILFAHNFLTGTNSNFGISKVLKRSKLKCEMAVGCNGRIWISEDDETLFQEFQEYAKPMKRKSSKGKRKRGK